MAGYDLDYIAAIDTTPKLLRSEYR